MLKYAFAVSAIILAASSSPTQAQDRRLWDMFCTGVSHADQRGIQTNFFQVYTADIENSGSYVAAAKIRETVGEWYSMEIAPGELNCWWGTEGVAEFRQPSYDFVDEMRQAGYRHDTIHVDTVEDY